MAEVPPPQVGAHHGVMHVVPQQHGGCGVGAPPQQGQAVCLPFRQLLLCEVDGRVTAPVEYSGRVEWGPWRVRKAKSDLIFFYKCILAQRGIDDERLVLAFVAIAV